MAVESVPSPLPVLQHRLIAIRRTWRGGVYTSLLLPVLFLLGMGISIGGYVDRGGTLGLSYLDYVAPGLLASTAAQIAVGEASYQIIAAFKWNRVYHAMRATPLRTADILAGEFAYIMVRVAVPAASFFIVMVAFGIVHSWWAIAAVPVAVLLAASMTGLTMAYSASIKSDNMFALLYRFMVIPMTLFAGVFFPVEAMPLVARWIAYVLPLWHGVELCRYATQGLPFGSPVVGHVGYLALWTALGYALARNRFAKRMAD
jgi:lipooligosaccharide transport system permease protein